MDGVEYGFGIEIEGEILGFVIVFQNVVGCYVVCVVEEDIDGVDFGYQCFDGVVVGDVQQMCFYISDGGELFQMCFVDIGSDYVCVFMCKQFS